MIGGSLEPWTHGPVVKPAYNRLSIWKRKYDKTRAQPELFRLVSKNGSVNRFEAAGDVNEDDLSSAEADGMNLAWQAIGHILDDWNACDKYFHDPAASFIGKAWFDANHRRTPIDWREVIDAYDLFNASNHSHIKTLMAL